MVCVISQARIVSDLIASGCFSRREKAMLTFEQCCVRERFRCFFIRFLLHGHHPTREVALAAGMKTRSRLAPLHMCSTLCHWYEDDTIQSLLICEDSGKWHICRDQCNQKIMADHCQHILCGITGRIIGPRYAIGEGMNGYDHGTVSTTGGHRSHFEDTSILDEQQDARDYDVDDLVYTAAGDNPNTLTERGNGAALLMVSDANDMPPEALLHDIYLQ